MGKDKEVFLKRMKPPMKRESVGRSLHVANEDISEAIIELKKSS